MPNHTRPCPLQRYLLAALAALVAALFLGGCTDLSGLFFPATITLAPSGEAPASPAPGSATKALASGEEASAPAPEPGPTVVPILYKMFDWGTDFQNQSPAWGPVGSIQFVTWEQINPAPGKYDWSVIDRELAKEARLRVTMPDGSQLLKPVVIQVFAYLSSAPNWTASDFYDATPQWVYDQIDRDSPQSPRPVVGGRKAGYVIRGCDKVAVMPMYDNSAWRNAYFDMVRAFGARYNDNPQVTSVVINTGIDGETQAIKDWYCSWKDLAEQQVSGVPYFFVKFVQDTMATYREAFPTKPIFINNAPGGSSMRKLTADYAATFTPPIGLKHSGMWIDLDSHQGYGTFVGSWDMIRTYSLTLPIWLESPYGLGGPENRYWSLIAGLHYHPDAIDLHQEYFTQSDPAWLKFVVDHLGVSIQDTPSVWTVLRDSEYPKQSWGVGAVSGHVGDWSFWLYRAEDAPQSATERVWRNQLPAAQESVYSRQARRTQQDKNQIYMAFDIDDAYPYVAQKPVDLPGGNAQYTVRVTLLNTGTDTLALQYRNWDGAIVSQVRRKGPGLGPVDEWVEVPFIITDGYLDNNLPGGADFRLSCEHDGDEYVHMVEVIGSWGLPPAATRPATAAAPQSPAPTPSSGASPAPTETAAPEQTPNPTTPAPTPTPAELVGAVRVEPSADTYLDRWRPTASPHRAGKLAARSDNVRVPLMQFDLTSLPTTAVVEKALLRVWVMDKTNPGSLTLSAYKLLRAWQADQCTWDQASSGHPWALPGAQDTGRDRSAVAAGQVLLTDKEHWYDLEMTDLVQAWVRDPASNYGLLLGTDGVDAVQYDLCSADYPDAALRPHLAIVWHEAAPGEAASPTAPPDQTPPGEAPPSPGQPPAVVQVRLQQGANNYQGVADSFLDAWSPDENQSKANKMSARQGSVRMPILRFALDSIPVQASVKRATLRLYVLDRTNAGPITTSIARVARPWDAGYVTWERATAGDAWAQPGAREPEVDRSVQIYASTTLSAEQSWADWDITPLVQDWVARPAQNDGLLLLSEGSASVQYNLASSEWYPLEFRPCLEIEYLTLPPSPTPAITDIPPATEMPLYTPTPTATALPSAGAHLFQQGTEGYTGSVDVYVDGDHPRQNYEDSPQLLLRQDGTRSALLRFDLRSVPTASAIQEARLSLYVATSSAARATNLQVFALLKPWMGEEVTYQRASRELAWHTEGVAGAGVDLAAEPEDAAPLPDAGQWVTLDITRLAREWVVHPEGNRGMALKLGGLGQAECALHSAEWSEDPALRPKLELVWGTAAPPPTVNASPVMTTARAPSQPTTIAATATPLPPVDLPPSQGPTKLSLQQGANDYQGVADAYLDTWSQTANFGTSPVLSVRQGNIQVGLIRFDLAQVPVTATVLSASLNLWVAGQHNAPEAPLRAYQMTTPWQEGAANWLEADLGRLWSAPGAGGSGQDYYPQRVSEARLSGEQIWASLDIIQAARQWVRDPQTNQGLLLQLGGSGDAQYQFASSQGQPVEQRPRLVMSYTLEPAAPRRARGALLIGAIFIVGLAGLVLALRGNSPSSRR